MHLIQFRIERFDQIKGRLRLFDSILPGILFCQKNLHPADSGILALEAFTKFIKPSTGLLCKGRRENNKQENWKAPAYKNHDFHLLQTGLVSITDLGLVVSRIILPPCTEVRNNFESPSRFDEKTICFPFGDQSGFSLLKRPKVS